MTQGRVRSARAATAGWGGGRETCVSGGQPWSSGIAVPLTPGRSDPRPREKSAGGLKLPCRGGLISPEKADSVHHESARIALTSEETVRVLRIDIGTIVPPLCECEGQVSQSNMRGSLAMAVLGAVVPAGVQTAPKGLTRPLPRSSPSSTSRSTISSGRRSRRSSLRSSSSRRRRGGGSRYRRSSTPELTSKLGLVTEQGNEADRTMQNNTARFTTKVTK